MGKSGKSRRIWRTSKLPTRPSSTTNKKNSTPSRAESKHNGNPNYLPPVDDQSGQPFIHRQLTLRAPATRPRHPGMPSHDEAQPPPNVMRKRGADPVSSAIEPAPKRPAHKIPSSAFATADVTVARRAKKNEVTFSSLTVQEYSQSAGQMNEHAPYVSKSPASKTRKQALVWGMDPFQNKYRKNTTSMPEHVTAVVAAEPRTKPTDARKRRDGCLLNIDFGPCAPGSTCRGCGSPHHKTKDCHVPFEDGTAIFCPFHDSSVLDKSVPHHPLDILITYHPGDDLKKRPHCPLAMSYKQAVQVNDRERMRYMLPQMFGELVLNRKRKPPIRVVSPELCPINVAIEFSREFCQGQMPSGLQGVWPYTLRDATNPAILAKLQQYENIGWLHMPPGELEAKSWDQVKHEYTQGIIPPQISQPGRKHMKHYQADMRERAAAEAEAEELYQRDRDAKLALEPQPIEEDIDTSDTSEEDEEVEEETLPPHTENTALMQEMLRLSAKVDNMAETLKVLRGKQSGKKLKSEPGRGTWSDPIDVEPEGISVGWYVE